MTEHERQLEFITRWSSVGSALEAIKRRELREFRHEDHVREIDGLLDLAARHSMPRTTSGFVEQQRLFRKAGR
jgi:hypothetical protein